MKDCALSLLNFFLQFFLKNLGIHNLLYINLKTKSKSIDVTSDTTIPTNLRNILYCEAKNMIDGYVYHINCVSVRT